MAARRPGGGLWSADPAEAVPGSDLLIAGLLEQASQSAHGGPFLSASGFWLVVIAISLASLSCQLPVSADVSVLARR